MKESETLEFKSSFSLWKEIIEALCAFSNRSGGTVIVGLNDNGNLTGSEIGHKTIEDFVAKTKVNTDPVLYPSIQTKTHGLGEIAEISIQESDQKPVFAFGKAFIRVGRTSVKLSSAEIRDLASKYKQIDFDSQISSESIKELEISEQVMGVVRRKISDFNAKKFIRWQKLTRGELLNNAAYLCFTQKNTEYYHACIKVGRFKGTDMVTILDMAHIDVGLLAATEDVLSFIKRNISMAVDFDGGAARIERWEYPLEALRETITNAIVHRDYTDNGQINIRIFDDRLEVWSPGLLPRGLTPEEIIRENRSVPRNRNIAAVFFHAGLIESWGSGFPRILSESKKHGGVKVEMSHMNGAFVVVFRKIKAVSTVINLLGEAPPQKYMSAYELRSEKARMDVGADLNKPQKLVYQTISMNPGLMAKDLSSMLSIPFGSMDRHVRVLLHKGYIVRRGSKKTGGYVVVK